jgi:polygalacturonase
MFFSALAASASASDFRIAAVGGRVEIQRAIDDAAAAGGGRVVVAPGVHPIGTLRLKSHVELHLEKGAILLGSTKWDDYDDFPRDVCSVSPES